MERAGSSIRLRLPDGTVKSMPTELKGPVTADRCCFCGETIGHSDEERISLTAHWTEEGQERARTWSAHRTCLAERMHDSVPDTGDFFTG